MILKRDSRLKAIMKVLKYVFLISLIIFLTECSPSRKNPYYQKRMKASRVNTTQLGRNRYYFSDGYQKKLSKSFKKIH